MKTVEFIQTTTGHVAKVNGIVVWFIRDEPHIKPNEGWFTYKSEDGGRAFKLIPAKPITDGSGLVIGADQWGFASLQDAKAFVYREETTTGAGV